MALLLLGLSSAAPPARAVLLAGGDGSINTTAPSPDPGFAHVGTIGGLSGVYVGGGWVLTAGHVGLGDFTLGGVVHSAIPGSTHPLQNPSGPDPDAILFKLYTRPALPDLVLATTAPGIGDEVVLIGNGRDRGSAVQIEIEGQTFDGWSLDAGRTLRWGTNEVGEVGEDVLDTRAFAVAFDEPRRPFDSRSEVQAVPGDSGGGVFRSSGGSYELLGLLFARGLFTGQPSDTALFGNLSYAADVSFYHDQIAAVVAQEDCGDGLDNDGDGMIDASADPGCDDADDASELSETLVCDNGLDDDGDGWIDWPEDDGCEDLLDASEVPEPGVGIGLLVGAAVIAARPRPDRPRRRYEGLSSRERAGAGSSPHRAARPTRGQASVGA